MPMRAACSALLVIPKSVKDLLTKGAACSAVRHSVVEAQVEEVGITARSWAAVTPPAPVLFPPAPVLFGPTCRLSTGAAWAPVTAKMASASKEDNMSVVADLLKLYRCQDFKD